MIEGHHGPCDEGVAQQGAATLCPEQHRPWVLAAAILGSSLAFIVGSVVNVALPAIQAGLGASAAEMQWVLNAYLLFLGALVLVGGSLGDHLGRRRVFAVGMVVFSAASVACGLAPDVGWLILARAVQGVGGALLVPSSLALISAAFPKEARGQAIGTWAGFSALTTALGPVLGGWLVDAFSWRWIFFVVVPLTLVALAITVWRVPESREEAPGRLDVPGAALATASLGALTYGLITSAAAGWGAWPVWVSLGGSAVLGAAFLWRERTAADPMLPLGLFRSTTFTGANVLTLGLYFALNGALYFLPFNLVQVQGYSATQAGAAFLPFTLLMGGLSRWSGGLLDRYGARKPLILGPILAAAGLALMAVPGTGGSYWTTFFPALLVLGLGMTVSVAPLTTVVMNAVPDAQAGTASGINNAAARIAGLLAIALLGVVALSLFSQALDAELARADLPTSLETALWADRGDLAGAAIPAEANAEQAKTLEATVAAAFVFSFRRLMLLAAGLALLASLGAALLIHPDRDQASEGPVG